jgi:hypothetical protein
MTFTLLGTALLREPRFRRVRSHFPSAARAAVMAVLMVPVPPMNNAFGFIEDPAYAGVKIIN